MNYPNTVAGTFVSRPNRFIAKVMINGEEETVHVKNTGRCRELLFPGATVILTRSDNPNRKTQYDLIAVYKGDTLINMDSQAPNAAARELLQRLYPQATVRAEQRYGSSRFDFALDLPSGTMFVEVKGVTLERQGHAFFPDAPTQRGAKHLRELIAARQAGNKAAVLFLVQMKGIHALSPNDETDPDFAKALREAHAAGVDILCYDCIITEDTMTADKPVAVIL
jgi:sugar fermentation stimulation protein A